MPIFASAAPKRISPAITDLWRRRALDPKSRPLDYWEYALFLLGDIRGQMVLDLGCGGGWITRFLVEKGATVLGCDVSLEGCLQTRERIEEDGNSVLLAIMDGHRLALRDGKAVTTAFARPGASGWLRLIDPSRAASHGTVNAQQRSPST